MHVCEHLDSHERCAAVEICLAVVAAKLAWQHEGALQAHAWQVRTLLL